MGPEDSTNTGTVYAEVNGEHVELRTVEPVEFAPASEDEVRELLLRRARRFIEQLPENTPTTEENVARMTESIQRYADKAYQDGLIPDRLAIESRLIKERNHVEFFVSRVEKARSITIKYDENIAP